MDQGGLSSQEGQQVVRVEPFVVRRKVAAQMLAGEGNLQRCIDAGWLDPIGGKERGMEFYVPNVRACAARAALEGWPILERPTDRKCRFA